MIAPSRSVKLSWVSYGERMVLHFSTSIMIIYWSCSRHATIYSVVRMSATQTFFFCIIVCHTAISSASSFRSRTSIEIRMPQAGCTSATYKCKIGPGAEANCQQQRGSPILLSSSSSGSQVSNCPIWPMTPSEADLFSICLALIHRQNK